MIMRYLMLFTLGIFLTSCGNPEGVNIQNSSRYQLNSKAQAQAQAEASNLKTAEELEEKASQIKKDLRAIRQDVLLLKVNSQTGLLVRTFLVSSKSSIERVQKTMESLKEDLDSYYDDVESLEIAGHTYNKTQVLAQKESFLDKMEDVIDVFLSVEASYDSHSSGDLFNLSGWLKLLLVGTSVYGQKAKVQNLRYSFELLYNSYGV